MLLIVFLYRITTCTGNNASFKIPKIGKFNQESVMFPSGVGMVTYAVGETKVLF